MKNINNQNAEVTQEVRSSLLNGVKSVSKKLVLFILLTGVIITMTSAFGIANGYTFLIFLAGFLASAIVVIQIFINFFKDLNKNDKDPKQKMGFKVKASIRK